jgi:UDPglucose 6-dehydrogenase
MEIVQATERVNHVQRKLLIRRITERFGENLQGHCFAIWGLAFKPQTDDMREAPSRLLIRQLIERGAEVQVHDPIALNAAKQLLAEDLADLEDGYSRVRFFEDAMAALHSCDALVVVTEWKHFHNPDFQAMKQQLRQPCIIDGRNLFDPQMLQDLGIAYQGVGRRNALARVATSVGVDASHQPSGLPQMV